MAAGEAALFRKAVVLSNGAQLPIHVAACYLAMLETYADGDGDDRNLLASLREACLGRPISDEQRQALIADDFLDAAGNVHASLRDLVLAAVHGHGKALYLVSPFTDLWDRMMADFFMARAAIRDQLSPEAAELLLNEPGFGGEFNTPEAIRNWTEHVRKNRGKPGVGGIDPLSL